MKKVIFVSDMFMRDYVGGAELTTNALIQKCREKYEVEEVYCQKITEDYVTKNIEAKFVICNFSLLSNKIKILLCKNSDYDIIEYDYKFCKYRSPEKHFIIEGEECNCMNSNEGKISKIFYGYAKKIWFMSETQMNIFLTNVPTIKKQNCTVLSSVFSAGDLRFINSIKDNEKNNVYLILDSNSWIKNTKGCVAFANQNGLEFDLVKNLAYHEMLIKMSTSKGLIFRPSGGDTCPRIVIEAKMLGCDIQINNNVQHKNEKWFKNQIDCLEYMSSRADFFMRNL
jgi:hypothetical protein